MLDVLHINFNIYLWKKLSSILSIGSRGFGLSSFGKLIDFVFQCEAYMLLTKIFCDRATTTYLVTRRIDMLPKPLTEDICSLRANVDRLAFSVIWELTPDIQTVAVSFTKSVIR